MFDCRTLILFNYFSTTSENIYSQTYLISEDFLQRSLLKEKLEHFGHYVTDVDDLSRKTIYYSDS